MVPESTSRLPVILSAARTPIGRFQGSLCNISAPKLGAIVIRAADRKSRDKKTRRNQ